MSSDFQFLVPEAFIQSLVQIDTVVAEKIQFEILHVHDLGPRSSNDLDLQYSHIFIYFIGLAVKKVKVTPGSSFEQTIMGWSPNATYQVS